MSGWAQEDEETARLAPPSPIEWRAPSDAQENTGPSERHTELPAGFGAPDDRGYGSGAGTTYGDGMATAWRRLWLAVWRRRPRADPSARGSASAGRAAIRAIVRQTVGETVRATTLSPTLCARIYAQLYGPVCAVVDADGRHVTGNEPCQRRPLRVVRPGRARPRALLPWMRRGTRAPASPRWVCVERARI